MIKNEPKSELEKSLIQAFKRYDKNNDGYLDLKDFEEKMTKTGEKLSAEEFQDMIRLADIDHDGRISYQGITIF
jgi:Ca2+-binding EF-hand superfamily protein